MGKARLDMKGCNMASRVVREHTDSLAISRLHRLLAGLVLAVIRKNGPPPHVVHRWDSDGPPIEACHLCPSHSLWAQEPKRRTEDKGSSPVAFYRRRNG